MMQRHTLKTRSFEKSKLLKNESKYIQLSAFEAAQCGDLDALKNFSKKELETKSTKGHTPLFLAIKNGQLKVVKYLLESVGVSLNTHPKGGNPLHYAASLGDFSIVKYLAEGPAKDLIHSRHPLHHGTPLDCAAEQGQINIVKYFITEIKATIVPDKCLPTPLHLAVENKHFSVVNYLINGPARSTLEPYFNQFYILKNDNQENIDYFPPLHQAAANGDLKSVKCLIEDAKIHPEKVNQDNLTALEFAIIHGELNDDLLAVLRYLIPISKTRFGNTPLHWAVEESKLPLVIMLVEEFKADIHARNIWGLSPLDCAKGPIKTYLESNKKSYPVNEKSVSHTSEQKEYKLPSFLYHTHTARRKSWCEYDEKIYEKEKKLGSGNCGEVFSFIEKYKSVDAKESHKPRTIAIKKAVPLTEMKPINLRQEAECFHKVYGIGGHDSDSKCQIAYTAMPFIDGKSLDRVTITTLIDFYKISIAMVKALNELHVKYKIVHTDLNLGNFMVQKTSSNDFNVKLIDFGLSLNIGQLLPQHLFLNEWLAPHYAPEVETPIPADPKQDVFTLGYLLVNSLYHKTKLPASSIPSYLKQMLAKDPNERPSLTTIQKELEADLVKLQQQQSISQHRSALFTHNTNVSLASLNRPLTRRAGRRN